MKHQYFDYTKDFLKKTKSFSFFIAIRLVLLMFLLFLSRHLSLPASMGVKNVDAKLVLLVVVLFCVVRDLNKMQRDYSGDKIYIDNNLLYFEKGLKTRQGSGTTCYEISTINKVKVTKNKLIIYGKVLMDFGRFNITHRKLVLTSQIINIEELIRFAQSKGAAIEWRN